MKKLFKKNNYNNIEEDKLLADANKIKKILKDGNYTLMKWINGSNKDFIWLCEEGKKPWEGIQIQELKSI